MLDILSVNLMWYFQRRCEMNVLISAFILIWTSSMNIVKEMEKRKGEKAEEEEDSEVSSDMGPEVSSHHSVFNGRILCGIMQRWKTAHIYIIHAEPYERLSPPTRSERIWAAILLRLKGPRYFIYIYINIYNVLEKVNRHESRHTRKCDVHAGKLIYVARQTNTDHIS